MSQKIKNESKALLKTFFGFDEFKGNQADSIDSILNGNNTFVRMPTGGGKSLCYQLPAIQMEGIAIVISPLIALMKNQVDSIRNFATSDSIAHVWNSSLTKREMVAVRKDLSLGETKLLYMAPESLNRSENIKFLKDLKISFYAIDEAHCISEWGHDFRPDYRQLRKAINSIENRPIMALTATATEKVVSDIQKSLEMKQVNVFSTSFNRPNLFYQINLKNEVEKDIIKLLKKHNGKSAIIYCLSRKKVEEITQVLQLNDIRALPYHAGLDNNTRSKHQDAFLNEDIHVIVATIAFGMGIDKPDVRLVLHHDIPKSIESYYQETGLGQIGNEKEIVVKYSDLEIQFGDLQEYVKVNDVEFFGLDGKSISDFPPFNFWQINRESFLFDMNNKNKFLKITYFPEYIEPKGEYGIQDKIHFFDSDCNLYDLVKEVKVIENFNVKIN